MRSSRQFVILALSLMVGLGFMGSGDLQAQPLKVKEVEIITPSDKLGIDDLLHIDVTVEDFAEDPTAEIVVFLVKKVERTDDAGRTHIDTVIIESGYMGDVQGKTLTERLTDTPTPDTQTQNAQDRFVSIVETRTYLLSTTDFDEGNYGNISQAAALLDPSVFIRETFTLTEDGNGEGDAYVPAVEIEVGGTPTPFVVGQSSDISGQSLTSGLLLKGSTYHRFVANASGDDLTSHNPIAAFRTADRGTDATRNIPAEWQGDADSLHITGTGSKGKTGADGRNKDVGTEYLVRWYTTGHHILGEADDVYAAAFVRRPPQDLIPAENAVTDETPDNAVNETRPALPVRAAVSETISPVVLSSNSISVDGDRPVQGRMYFVQEESDGDYSDVALNYAGKGYAKEAKGRDRKVVEDFGAITGEPSGDDRSNMGITTDNQRIVLGIGDSLRVYVKLDDVEYSTIRSESELKVLVDVGKMEGGEFKKQKPSPSTRTDYHRARSDAAARTVLEHVDGIAEGDYGNLEDQTTVLQAHLQDGAGNAGAFSFFITLAGNASTDLLEAGPNQAEVNTSLLFDAARPELKTYALHQKKQDDKGDTVIFAPRAGDVLSGGGPKGRYTDLPADLNPVAYRLNETLSQLKIEMKSQRSGLPTVDDLVIDSRTSLVSGSSDDEIASFTFPALKKDNELSVDISDLIDAPGAGSADTVNIWRGEVGGGLGQSKGFAGEIGKHAGQFELNKEGTKALLSDGKDDYIFTFVATDLAGNTSDKEERSGVALDLKDIGFTNLFPMGQNLDELGEASSSVFVELDKAADTLAVIYKHLGPGGEDKTKNDSIRVGGDGLLKGVFHDFRKPELEDGKRYYVRIDVRDAAGNWHQAGPDTFDFNEDHVLEGPAAFVVGYSEKDADGDPTVLSVGAIKVGDYKDEDNDDFDDDGRIKIAAGDTLTLTIQAQTDAKKTAFLHREAAVLTVKNGQSVHLVTKDSPGASQASPGSNVIELDAAGWGADGKRKVSFRETVSEEELIILVQDKDESISGAFTLPDTIEVEDNDYAKLEIGVPSEVMRGEDFTVTVRITDEHGNLRQADSRFVNVTANQIGAGVPAGDVPIQDGEDSFVANSGAETSFTKLVLTVRDIVQVGTGPNAAFIHGISDTIAVTGDPVVPPTPPVDPPVVVEIDPPDTLIAEDYRGALGEGDQGGFVLLTFDPSDNHDIIDGYRIYRQIAVNWDLGDDGGIVEKDTTALVPWGFIGAIPDPGLMRVVVATLDNDSTPFVIGAEYVVATNKQAFTPGMVTGANPYELMAQTMVNSKEAAAPQVFSDGTLLATLTPEALAFGAKGIVPLLKSVSNVYLSEMVFSVAVRAVDNIPPGAIPYLKVLDTPADAGGSITVSWAKSPDDQIVTSSVGEAVGGQVYTTAGVKGYNVYRKVGDAAFDLVGQAGFGENSFEDQMVFNGIRYTYQVRPYDEDNIGETILEKTALAIRNRVFDGNGNLVLGLFGTDNQVGFDDFFILADQFGLTAEEESFEPAFDLSPNNKIDLNDFFTFADFFGRAVEGVGKGLPVSMAGLNSEARFYLDAGTELPRVGEEMVIAVSLQDFVELKGYGLSVSYDPEVLAYVGTEVENSILGAGEFAEGQLVSNKDGLVSLVAYGDVGTEGDLGLNLVFRSLREIENSYIQIVDGELRDGNYGLNTLGSVSVLIQTRPEAYALRNNFPNPFNPETTLKYDLPDAGDVKLVVYNMLGQAVRTLVNEHKTAGRYAVQWDATNDRGQAMSSGIYFYRVQVEGEFTDVKKMLLLK